MFLSGRILKWVAIFMIATPMLCSNAETNSQTPQAIKEYAIVLLPSSNVSAKAATMNQKLSTQLPGENPSNNWHVTLYHVACDEASLAEIIHKLRSLKVEPITLKFKHIYSTADRWVDWGMQDTAAIHTLHGQIVKFASNYSKRPLNRARDIYETLPPEKKTQVDKYGVSGVLEFYIPHMTLFYRYPADARLQDIARQFANENGEVEINCNAVCIAVGELGYNGNMVKVIERIEIG